MLTVGHGLTEGEQRYFRWGNLTTDDDFRNWPSGSNGSCRVTRFRLHRDGGHAGGREGERAIGTSRELLVASADVGRGKGKSGEESARV